MSSPSSFRTKQAASPALRSLSRDASEIAMEVRYDVLIVGSGHGGANAAIALRRFGFEGTVAIVSAEPDPPYERPPLSKDYLAGERPFERLLFRPEAFWAEQKIALLPGREVMAIDAAAGRVALADGRTLAFGALIWAAGGRARHLACDGGDLARVHEVRSRADIDALRAELTAAERVA